MKYFFFKILTILSLSLLFLPAISFAQQNLNRETETLKKLEYDWLTAEFRLDTATISKMMDAAFISVNLSGILNKQEELDGIYRNISQRINDRHIVDSLFLDDFQVQTHGFTAIVTFVSITKGSIKGIPFSNRRTRFYDVWIKQNGKWKAVSSQGTPIQ